MSFKKYILAFSFSFFISILIYLYASIDLEPDLKKMAGVSIIIAIVFTLTLFNLEKPLRKKYKETFDKNYRYHKMRSVAKERKM